MVGFVFSLWSFFGVIFFYKEDFVGLAWVFCWKEVEESVRGNPFVSLLIIWKDRNRSFENKELFMLRQKNVFLCYLFSQAKMYIVVGPMSPFVTLLIGWILTTGRSSFCFPSLFWQSLYASCMLWCTFFLALLMHLLFTYLKKNIEK